MGKGIKYSFYPLQTILIDSKDNQSSQEEDVDESNAVQLQPLNTAEIELLNVSSSD